MRRPWLHLFALAASTVLLVGCADLFGSAPPPERMMGEWVLTDGRVDAAPIEVPDGHFVTLTIGEEELGGTAACNSYGAPHEIGGTDFALADDVHQTLMGCEDTVMETEQRYLDALQRADTIELVGQELVLAGPDVELRFERPAG